MQSLDSQVAQLLERRFGMPKGSRAPIRALIRLADEVGFRWVCGTWGERKKGGRHQVSDVDDLSHELAHYMLAPKHRRDRWNYGLGEPGIGNAEASQREEEYVSAFGWMLMDRAGFSSEYVRDGMDEHNWDKKMFPLSLVDCRCQYYHAHLYACGLIKKLVRPRAVRERLSDVFAQKALPFDKLAHVWKQETQ